MTAGRALFADTNLADVYNTTLARANLGIPQIVTNIDPTASNDQTQGYGVGSEWYNTTSNRMWDCLSAATGAAVWALGGVVPGVGVEPSSMLTQFGSGTANFPEEGNINRQIAVTSNSPAGTGSDYVMALYTLPASSFDALGRGIAIIAQGSFANNANSKRVKIIYAPTSPVVGSVVSGGTVIADTGIYSTTGAVGWMLQGNVFKYGSAGSNTQIGLHNSAQMGATVGSLLTPSLLTAAENGTISIVLTGNATTTTTDVVWNFVEVNAMN